MAPAAGPLGSEARKSLPVVAVAVYGKFVFPSLGLPRCGKTVQRICEQLWTAIGFSETKTHGRRGYIEYFGEVGLCWTVHALEAWQHERCGSM